MNFESAFLEFERGFEPGDGIPGAVEGNLFALISADVGAGEVDGAAPDVGESEADGVGLDGAPGGFPGFDEGVLEDVFGVGRGAGLLTGEEQEPGAVFLEPCLPRVDFNYLCVVVARHGLLLRQRHGLNVLFNLPDTG